MSRLCTNTDSQRACLPAATQRGAGRTASSPKGRPTCSTTPACRQATSEIAIGSKLGLDATKKLPDESFKRPWPPLIKMDAAVKAKVEKLFNP
ncbi:MAG: hypothetical protein HY674_21110 [Chloroflexi bacterium]|nr:hypothetical protein [Chloroflexota bacterium]